MKYKYAILIAIMAFSASSVLAVTVSATPQKDFVQTRQTIKTELASTTKSEKEKLANDLKIQQEKAKTLIDQKRNGMIINVFQKQVSKVEVRIQATIERIQNIMSRVIS